MARETIPKILQDLSLKARKRGIVIKIMYPDARTTPRNYMIVLLNDKSKLYGTNKYSTNKCDANDLLPEFAVNLAGNSSRYIGVPESAYIVKPTLKDYLELWEMYTSHKKNGIYNKSNKESISL